MTEEFEYHTTDPYVESATHKIRKQFRQTMQELKHKGHLIENIEAFLVNTEDMRKLDLLFSGSKDVPGGPLDGQMKMYGVKIIESPYIPEGTIFKVFKNEDQMQYPVAPMPISGSIDVSSMGGSNCSGVIPNWNQPMPPGLPTPQIPNYAYQYEPDDKEDEKETEPVEKRHSTKRRIELDE